MFVLYASMQWPLQVDKWTETDFSNSQNIDMCNTDTAICLLEKMKEEKDLEKLETDWRYCIDPVQEPDCKTVTSKNSIKSRQ